MRNVVVAMLGIFEVLMMAACAKEPAVLGQLLASPRTTSSSSRTPGMIAEYPVPKASSAPDAITRGPDGNVWFTEDAGDQVGRITPAGVISEYHVPPPQDTLQSLAGIVTGPDGNIWLTQASATCQILKGHRICLRDSEVYAMTTGGTIVRKSGVLPFLELENITNGPGKDLWIAERLGHVSKITLSGRVTTFKTPPWPHGIAAHDGDLWITTADCTYSILKVTPNGTVTQFSSGGSDPWGITVGPDGNMWFTEGDFCGPGPSAIGRITPDGVVTLFSTPTANSAPTSIVKGPDGDLWFTEYAANMIGRVTPEGVITEYPITTPDSKPWAIAVGSDGNLWFTELGANKIGEFRP